MSSPRRWLQRLSVLGLLTPAAAALTVGPAAAAVCEPWEVIVGAWGGNPVCAIGVIGEGSVEAAKRSVMDEIAKSITDGVNWAGSAVGDSMRSAGKPDLEQAWFTESYQVSLSIGAMFACIALACAVIYAGLTRDGREIGRSLAQVLVAGVSTGMIGSMVMMANQFIDYVCDMALGANGWTAITDSLRTVAQALAKAGAAQNDTTSMALPAIMIIIIGLLMLLALCVVWCEMMIRRIAVDLCVVFWPLAVAGSVWPKARQWQSRLADTILTVLLAKPVIVIVLKLGSGALREAKNAGDLITAAGLYMLAALAPYLVMQMIGIIGGAFQPGGSGQGMRQAGLGGVMGIGASAASLAASMIKSGPMQGGGSTPSPSPRGQAAATQTTHTASRDTSNSRFSERLAELSRSDRPSLPSGESRGERRVLEGTVIPGQLVAAPTRAALPPGPSAGPGGGSPSSPGPSAPAPPPSSATGGAHRYSSPHAPIAPPPPRSDRKS